MFSWVLTALSSGDTKTKDSFIKKIFMNLHYADKNSTQYTFKWKYPAGVQWSW